MLDSKIESFIRENRIVSDAAWNYAIDRADRCQGRVSLESLFREFDQLLPEWSSADQLESPVTPYHRELILKLAQGVRLSPPTVRIGEYLLLEMLGRGGQASAYRAVRWPSQTSVRKRQFRVVKVGRRGDLRLHTREAKILQTLSQQGCRRVPRLYGAGETYDKPYIVTSYREGLDLRQFIKRNGRLTVNQAVFSARKLVQTLQTAHGAGVIHRDLKPSNLVVSFDQTAKVTIIDWGLGAFTTRDMEGPDPFETAPELSVSSTRVGTFAWMSPEHFHNSRSVVPASDVYSAGCILFYMLTGEAPFSGSAPELTYHHSFAPRPSVNARRRQINSNWKDVPAQWDELIQQMMAIEIDQRPDLETCDRVLKEGWKNPLSMNTLTSVDRISEVIDTEATRKSDQNQEDIPTGEYDLTVATLTSAHDSIDVSSVASRSGDRHSTIPTRTSPWLVNVDFLIQGHSVHAKLARAEWPELLITDEEFQQQLRDHRRSFDSDSNQIQSEELQRLAHAKERVGNQSGALDQWQAAWMLTPWNSNLQRHYFRVLRSTIPLKQSSKVTIPRVCKQFRKGQLKSVLQSTESRIRRDPWSINALWERAVVLDLLGYWEACHTTVGLMLACQPKLTEDMTPVLVVSARVAALVGNAQQAQVSLNAIRRLSPTFASTTEFQQLSLNIDAQLATLNLKRRSHSSVEIPMSEAKYDERR
ncbi:MAG: serine/threonine protein kinase [Planctomycetaceae bacterium]|nr:serine/threonine protein kinase [Planctomycetaceae bacterium]